MANLTLKSESQIVGNMARTVMALTGLNDLNPGSIILTLLQAAAQEDFAQYYQMLQIVRNYNLDTTTGSDLDNRAFEYGLSRIQPLASTGRINILRAASFVKIATTFYSGFRSSISGDTQIFVNDASAFPTTGPVQTLIIGRGTPNEETINYVPSGTNPQNNVNYFTITLATPLANDHSLEETIILQQGANITVRSGTIVQVPASGRTPQITFATTVDATILSGEAEIDDVNIQCTQPGTIGNIGVNAITGTGAFLNPPFSGARAINDAAFSNGQDKETDTSLRNRIKSAIQAISQSTIAGISNAIIGLVDSTTAKRVVSANIIVPDNVGLPVKIYIDDGTGFEPDFSSQGEEVIIASAKGGESRLQLDFFPLVKAQLETLGSSPFDMSTDGLTLQVNVGTQSETLTFFQNMFAIPTAATAFEIVKAINANSLLIEARTAEVGTKVTIDAQTDTNENIQVVGGTANARLNFPTNEVETFYLYKNDVLLSKDGETAFIDSGNSEPYNFNTSPQALSVTVDGKTANIQTVTINTGDFSSPAAAAVATADQIAAIINNQLAGATASAVNGKVRITSNTQLSASSKIQINSSAAQSTLGFATSEVDGQNEDYTLNPQLGVIQLNVPLVANDLVTAGTRNTRGFLTASVGQNYAFTGGETLIITVDGGSPQTITFVTGSNQTADNVASFINQTLVGGTATTRTRGLNTYLEIRTNTFNPTQGSIEISSSSTSNSIFGFTTNVVVPSILPHTAYAVSGNSGPYVFIEGDTLVVVMDDNDTGETFVITMDYAGVVTSGSSTTLFGASQLTPIFPVNNSLANFWIVFKSGMNTTSGSVGSVSNPTTGVFQYNFKNPAPANFQSFAAGDQASFSGMNQAANDGNFLVQSTVSINNVHSPVISNAFSNPATLTPSSGDRYLVAIGANTTVNPNSVIDLNIANPGDSGSVAISIASPAVFTATNHELNAGNPVIFSTTGTLPTGLVAGTTYYVISDGLTANAFEVSATVNGTAINTSGSQSGSQSFASPSALVPSTGDRHIIAAGANNTTQPNVQGRYTDSTNVAVQEINGYRYVINGVGLNAWAGHNNQIATYNGVGTPGWVFSTPSSGDVVFSVADNTYHQFDGVSGTWILNTWGGKAGKVAQWTGSAWTFTTPLDQEVRNVTSLSKLYQYSASSNTWTENDWGGNANRIAQWNGSTWIYDSGPATNDTVFVTSASNTYQYNGSNWSVFVFWIQVTNAAGIAETATTGGTGLIGQRRQISAYNSTSGAVTLAAALRSTPSVFDNFVILPGTRSNVVTYLNNTKITSLPTVAFIELSNQGQKVEISSQQDGSDGYVQVTGGKANSQLDFSNNLFQGLQAYSYYTGLIKLVSDTIYGNEQDLVTFPGVGAAGVKYIPLPPTVNEVSFSVNVTLSAGTSLSNVQNDLITKIISYVNGLGVATEVILSNIVENLLQVQGVIDAVVVTPSANVVVGQNELARTKASLITINVVT